MENFLDFNANDIKSTFFELRSKYGDTSALEQLQDFCYEQYDEIVSYEDLEAFLFPHLSDGYKMEMLEENDEF